jgi:hypothetical protein
VFWPPRFIFRPNDNICKEQAVKYAKRLGFLTTTLAVFVPVEDEETLAKLSGEQTIDGVRLYVAAIGWV